MDSDQNDDGKQKRDKWSHPFDFVLSTLGYAVGLGNVWRFPYLCYENGGGAFLIPYALMLMLIGIPMFMYELALGQYSGKGTYHVWDVAPVFRGVGVAMLWRAFLNLLFYSQIVAWSVYYMFASLKSVLPWDNCANFSHLCYTKSEAMDCEAENGTWYNMTCYSANATTSNSIPENLTSLRKFPSQEFFSTTVLQQTAGIEDTGGLLWDLSLCRLFAFTLVFFCMFKSIRSSGKIVYFTATFPYVILTVLVIKGCMLEGAIDGITFYLVPTWSKLARPKVWLDAASQIYFSLGAGTGALLTLSSYNRFNNNILRDTLVVTTANCVTSFYSGFAIFSVLGFIAHEMGQKVNEVAKPGSGLAFIVYPAAISHLPVAPLWSFIFFFMCILLGLDSLFGAIENLMTAALDIMPRLRRYKPVVAAVICSSLFICGLTTCTGAGQYWTDLLNHYVAGWSAIILALLQIVIVSWVYGARLVKDHVEEMIRFTITPLWIWMWKIVTPLLLLVILCFNFIDYKPLEYDGRRLPLWAQGLGWLITLSVIACPVVYAIIYIAMSYKDPAYTNHSAWQRLRDLARPNVNWGPQDDGTATVPATQNGAVPLTARMIDLDAGDDIRQMNGGGGVQLTLLEHA